MDTDGYGTIGERVMRGLAWIGEHGVEFELDLDRVPSTLSRSDMASPANCVLGYARGWVNGRTGYWAVGEQWVDRRIDQCVPGEADEWIEFAKHHGFVGAGYDDYADLAAAWSAVLTEQRDPGAWHPPTAA